MASAGWSAQPNEMETVQTVPAKRPNFESLADARVNQIQASQDASVVRLTPSQRHAHSFHDLFQHGFRFLAAPQ